MNKVGLLNFLLVVSGPSGVGKSTILNNFLNTNKNVTFAVSATTRQPREGEKHGVDYYFLTKQEFEEKIKNNEFLEYNQHFNNYYGTLNSEIERNFKEGKNVVLDIDTQGLIDIRKTSKFKVRSIFIAPPSIQELRNRLTKRGEKDPEMRVSSAEKEISRSGNYDVVVINNDLEKAKSDFNVAYSSFLR